MQQAAAAAAAAPCPYLHTYHSHWQMNVAMSMWRLCGRQSYTNAIDSGQCDADAGVAVAVDSAAVAAVIIAAAAVGSDCPAIDLQRTHCSHWGPVSCCPAARQSSCHHCSRHAALSLWACCWDYCCSRGSAKILKSEYTIILIVCLFIGILKGNYIC